MLRDLFGWLIGWSLMFSLVTVMDIYIGDRHKPGTGRQSHSLLLQRDDPVPGDNPLLGPFSLRQTPSKESFSNLIGSLHTTKQLYHCYVSTTHTGFDPRTWSRVTHPVRVTTSEGAFIVGHYALGCDISHRGYWLKACVNWWCCGYVDIWRWRGD